MLLERIIEGVKINMCKALQDLQARGKAEGIKEGKLEQQLTNLRAIMTNLKLTAEKAMDVLNVPQEEHRQYLEML